MSNIYRPDTERGYLLMPVACEECARLKAENHDLRVKVEALSLTLDLFRKAILADYEFRGFPDAESYINDLIIEQVKREEDNGYEGKWPC